jgi:predicted transglutaminase-like protease
VEENEDYVNDISRLYLKYDLAKSQRLNGNEEKKLIRRVLESNNVEYTTQKVCGPFSDEITFDYQVGNVCIKMFSFKEKNLKRVIGSARHMLRL